MMRSYVIIGIISLAFLSTSCAHSNASDDFGADIIIGSADGDGPHLLPQSPPKGCLEINESNECTVFTYSRSNSSLEEDSSYPQCLRITGFSDRDFHANGIYCKLGQNGTYHLTSTPDALRYELRRINNKRWDLLRVIKTKRGAWVGFAIYAGFSKSGDFEDSEGDVSEALPQSLDWLGLSLNHSGGKETTIDRTEPVLNVTSIEATSYYIHVLERLNKFRSDEIDSCHVSKCDNQIAISTAVDPEWCTDYWKVAAHLSEVVGNYNETAHRLLQARTCALTKIYDRAEHRSPIPRYHRWEVAELSYLMTRSLVKAGMLNAALNATVVGLANSPEQKQRRRLYADLGDLKLAMGESEGAFQAYRRALEAVREKGGAIESKHFLSSFEESVGDFVGQQLSRRRELFGGNEFHFIPSNYTEVRTHLLLQVNNGNDNENFM